MITGRQIAIVLGALQLAVLVPLLVWQARGVARLRAEVAELRAARPAERVFSPAPATPAPAVNSEILELQAEVDRLRAEVARAESPATSANRPDRPQSAWTNRGGGTPFDALGTVLWASAGGEVRELEKWIAFEPDAEVAAQRFMAGLPPALRAEFPDARRLVATMMAARLPLDVAAADVLAETPVDSVTTALRLNVTRNATPPREMELRFHRDAAGWRLLVPREIIDGYHFILTGSPTAAGPRQKTPKHPAP